MTASSPKLAADVPFVINKANVEPRDTGCGERVYELAGSTDGNIHKHCNAPKLIH